MTREIIKFIAISILFLPAGLDSCDNHSLPLQMGDVKWEVPTGKIGWSAPAIGADGAVYISDMDGYLYGIIDKDSLWEHKWKPVWLADDIGESSPTMTADGKKLYLGSNTRPSRFFSINTEDGSVNWEFTIPDNPNLYGGGLVSSPALSVDEKTIYVGTGPWDSDLEPGPTTWLDDRLFAFEDLGDSVKVKWVFQPKEETDAVRFSFFGNPAVDSDGSIYAGTFGGYFYKLKDAGDHCEVLWKHVFKRRVSTSITEYQEVWGSPSIGGDGTVYIATNDHQLHAFTPEGEIKWQFDTGGEVWTTPVIANNGLIIIGSEDGFMYGLRDEGAEATVAWKYSGQEEGTWWGTATVAADGTVIFGSEAVEGDETGVYHAIDEEDGSFKWKTKSLGHEARTPAAISDDGTIYVTGGEGENLFAIKGSAPLAESPWPKMQRDNLNSGKRRTMNEER